MIKKVHSGLKNNFVNWTRENIFLGLLFLGNILLVWQFFSIEFPFVFSAPIVPFFAEILKILGFDQDSAVRAVLLIFYALGPLTLFFLVHEVTGRKVSAWLAAILYSLPVFRARFEAMVVLGDGAYVASLTFITLAAYWLLRFLRTGNYRMSLFASLFFILVALTSPFGLFILLAVMVVITFSEMMLGSGRLKFFRFLWVIAVSMGLSAFWYNPSFVQLSLASAAGQAVVMAVKNLIPISFFIMPILGAIGFLIFDRRPQLQPLFIALGLTVVFGLISFAEGLAKFAISGQKRYLPVLIMSIAFLWGVVGVFVYDLLSWLPVVRWFPVPRGKRKLLRRALVAVFVIVCLVSIVVSPYERVLDRFSGVRRTGSSSGGAVIDISQVREMAGGVAKFSGYAISILTAGMLFVLFLWIKKKSVGISEG